MFNVVKILSSGSNVPEPCRMATNDTQEYRIGSALKLSGGKLAHGGRK